MTLVFIVMTGALATFSASVRNLVSGRQRTGAVAVARSVIEEARASLYAQVAHDLSGDTTLAADASVSGAPLAFEGESLVGSAAPIFPEHRWSDVNDTTTYTVDVYVTWVTQGNADPFKRLTVIVSWANAQYDTATIANRVRLSSFLFEAGVPPDPLVDGAADVDGGTVEVTGTFDGIDLSRAVIYNPSAVGAVSSLFVREATGLARSSSGVLEVASGTVSGCDVNASATSAQCDGIFADTATDSDASTGLPENDAEGPVYDVGHEASAGTVLTLDLGANDAVESKSTSRSCFTCYTTTIGDDDRLASHWSEGSGPDSAAFGFDVGPVSGDLVRLTGASLATSSLDHDAVNDTHMLSAFARLQMPSVDVVTVQGAPTGFVGAVRISSVDVQVDAAAGPTALSPSVTGGAIEVQVYDTLGGTLGYRTISVDPGEEKEESATASFDVGGASVTLATTVVSGGKATSSTTDASGNITYAEASLTNWLRISVEVDIVLDGTSLADSMVEFDYGRLAARAQWESA